MKIILPENSGVIKWDYDRTSGVQISFPCSKIKTLVAKQNRASLSCGTVINSSIPRAPYQLAIFRSTFIKRGIDH